MSQPLRREAQTPAPGCPASSPLLVTALGSKAKKARNRTDVLGFPPQQDRCGDVQPA